MNELERVLKSDRVEDSEKVNDMESDFDELNPFHEPENDEKLIADGSADFDEYDKSGRNPFF